MNSSTTHRPRAFFGLAAAASYIFNRFSGLLGPMFKAGGSNCAPLRPLPGDSCGIPATMASTTDSPASNPAQLHSAVGRVMKWVLVCLLAGGLAFLAWFSFHLASIRILQVDECGNVFVARHLATGDARTLGGSVDLFQCLLSLLEHGAVRSIDLFINARFLMLEIFWLNVFLIALATGEKLFSVRGLVCLAGAATLAPLWDYGFEARHDNLVLTGVLVTWCLLRAARKIGLQSYFIAGSLLVISQFFASKSFVYTLPVAALMLVFPPPNATAPRWKLALGWAAGALTAFAALFFIYRAAGLWGVYVEGGRRMSAVATGSNRFAPWDALGRLLSQTPLLLALLAAALTGSLVELIRRGKSALSWQSSFPEAALFAVCLAALFVNPTPYPYNLLHLVPYAYLFAWRYAESLSDLHIPQALAPACIATILFAHVIPFGLTTRRHTQCLNYRQERLMRLAEDLTDPKNDPVYDAIGMVPTRAIVDRRSFLHGTLIKGLVYGSGPHLRDMLAANPPAVFVPNYRTDWLPEEEHDFIGERYVALADDFWVLGRVLSKGGGTFEIIHPGRYRISTLKGSDLADTYPVGMKGLLTPEDDGKLTATLDGAPLSAHPVQLAAGVHRLECAPDCQAAVVWMGPHLERVHRIGPGDHRFLFYNWY